MKICFYNWVDFDDSKKRGGGVTVYQKNIMNKSTIISDDVFFISSGVYYKYPFKTPFYTKNNNCYRLYNSKVLAPAIDFFASPAQITDNETEQTFINIIHDIGGVDIIHFNNLEGIPANVLKRLKIDFPNIKIVYSVHNYYPICPNVSLWKNNQENCSDFSNGADCVNCGHYNIDSVQLKKYEYQNVKTIFPTISKKCFRLKLSLKKKLLLVKKELPEESLIFLTSRRNDFIDLINQYVDKVLCVSKRVEEICVQYGIKQNIIETQYIGTEHAIKFNSSNRISNIFKKNKDNITICYLGYMRKDKGFHFFLNSLVEIPEKYAKSLNVIIAARNIDRALFDRMNLLSGKFRCFEYYDGYDHNNIDIILEKVDLGIIPPIWEDNLPQVAIEQHCRSIPLLCSNAGGASELNRRNPDYTFVAGDTQSFLNKLFNIIDTVQGHDEYWKSIIPPISMEEHVRSLKCKYDELLGL